MDDPHAELIRRWRLSEYFGTKTFYGGPSDPTGSSDPGDVRARLGAQIAASAFEDLWHEVPPPVIVRLLPTPLARWLLGTSLVLSYQNGEMRSHYDARRNEAVVKDTHSLLHEIGHALWYLLVPADEAAARRHAIASLERGERRRLPDARLPTLHRRYARLVGAASAQFLAPPPAHRPRPLPGNGQVPAEVLARYAAYVETAGEPAAPSASAYANDLEEHFARNLDYLLKGRPLYVLPPSTASLDDLLALYRAHGVIDAPFEAFFRHAVAGTEGLRRAPPDQAPLGDAMTTRHLQRINVSRLAAGLEPVPTRPAEMSR
jgi:hypothetical protein